MRSWAGFAFFASFMLAGVAHAQPRPVCVPGTPYCAQTDGNGGVHVQGGGQVGPNGASANGSANGGANGWVVPPSWPPPPPPSRPSSRGRFGFGFGGCPAGRVGMFSGFKVGGCAAVSFRWESIGLELESQLLYGGTTRSLDWTFPVSFLIPFGKRETLFEGFYLRFGGSPIGATFAKTQYGGGFVRFGVLAGAGYELRLGSFVTWRVLDARIAFDMGTKRRMDRLHHFYDPGLQLSTGLVF